MVGIVLRDVAVDFQLYQSSRSFKSAAVNSAIGGLIGKSKTTGRVSVRALSDITLELKAGDRLALLGHNGAGKTTLLRVLGGIYHPTVGTIASEGHVVPLFDIGLGMDDEASGYENIMLRGLVMGFSRKDIQSRMNEIADFTQLGEFLNMPVRTYSTGMLVRLLFGIATSVKADILLMDEWLSAGDRDFIERANRRLQELVDSAHILVLASHDLNQLRRVCTKGIWLEHGRIKMLGPVGDVIDAYTGVAKVA